MCRLQDTRIDSPFQKLKMEKGKVKKNLLRKKEQIKKGNQMGNGEGEKQREFQE